MSLRVRTNADEVTALINHLAEQLPKRVKNEILAEYVTEVYTVSQMLVPIRTGHLQRSGRVNKQAGTVNYDADYAGYVEFGTSKMDAQPYVRPAMKQARQVIRRLWRPLVKKILAEKVIRRIFK